MADVSSKKITARSTTRVSLRDVARAAGVSHVTVMLALRKDARVSEARRVEIEKIAKRMGYRPDPMLSSLAAYSMGKKPAAIRSTLAWLNQWSAPKALRGFLEFDAYWKGAKAAAEELGYRLEEFVLDKEMTGPRLTKILNTRNVRGILLPPHKEGFNLPDFDWSQFSIVKFGSSIKNLPTHIVTADQMRCASNAYDLIMGRGYTRIGYVSSREFERNTRGSFSAGYLAAQDTHVPYRKHLSALLMEDDTKLTPGDIAKTKAWLRSAKPEAILTSLATLPQILTRLKYRVPQDVAVATLSMLDGHFDTGMDQNSYEVGRVAVSTLAALIHQNQRGLPEFRRRVLVEGKWVDGTSLPGRKEK